MVRGWSILCDSKLVHYFLENTRHEVRTLVLTSCPLGRPTSVKNFVKALTMVLVLIFLRGIASGNLVDVHMIVNWYWLPDFVFGSGPTQSTIICLNGSWTACRGCSGAFGIVWLGFPTIWQAWEDLQYSATSFLRLGQWKCSTIFWWVLLHPSSQPGESPAPYPKFLACKSLGQQSGT